MDNTENMNAGTPAPEAAAPKSVETPVTEPVEKKEESKTETPKETVPRRRPVKFEMDRRTTIAVIAVVIVLAALWQFKSLFVAVTVNGSPISRLAVVQELEKQSGKQALDTLITKKLIRDEATKEKIIVTPAEVDQQINDIKQQIAGQGLTFDQALAQQNMTEADLREQITLQKQLEKILGNKVAVSDDEVNKYISDNKLTPPQGTDATTFKNQVRDQLKSQKFSQAAGDWIDAAKAAAKINYFVDYAKPEPAPAAPAAPATPTPPTTPGQ